jgi:hypothetical protein
VRTNIHRTTARYRRRIGLVAIEERHKAAPASGKVICERSACSRVESRRRFRFNQLNLRPPVQTVKDAGEMAGSGPVSAAT